MFTAVAVFISCEPDDGPTVTFEEADRTEQQIIDDSTLVAYVSSHYYNSSFFENGSSHKYSDIIITELPQDDEGNYLDMPNPDQNTLLIDAIETHTTVYLDVDYKYYILRINQGDGESPKFTDQVRVRYEGSSAVSEEIFDGVSTPVELSLVGNGFTTFGTIKAWQLVIPSFNAAFDFTIGGNGIVNYSNFGLGVMFVPSGLAYFSGITTGSAYDNLIFKFELLQFEQSDHDTDGIPSYLEDLDGDLDVNNDDTDEDGFPDFIDLDDDGDGVSTTDELIPTEYVVDTNIGEDEPILSEDEYVVSRDETNGIIIINTVTVADSNNDGLPDYLDEDIIINYNEVSN